VGSAIGKLLAGALIALTSAGLFAGQAHASQSPFSNLSSGSQETAAPGSPARKAEIRQGLQDGLSAPVSHPSAPALSGLMGA
jgi:hypothetical protein